MPSASMVLSQCRHCSLPSRKIQRPSAHLNGAEVRPVRRSPCFIVDRLPRTAPSWPELCSRVFEASGKKTQRSGCTYAKFMMGSASAMIPERSSAASTNWPSSVRVLSSLFAETVE